MPDYMNTPITDDEIRRSRGRRSFFPAADAITRQETGRAIAHLRSSGFTDREIGSAVAGVHSAQRERLGGLYPPGPGTYYNARRYADAPLSNAIVARANLTKAWGDDLEFNRVANPAAYASEVSNRAIARIQSQPASGRLVTRSTPSGGTITYLDRSAAPAPPVSPPTLGQRAMESLRPAVTTPVQNLPDNPFAVAGRFSLYPAGETPFRGRATPTNLPSPLDTQPIAFSPGAIPRPSPTPGPRRYFDEEYN